MSSLISQSSNNGESSLYPSYPKCPNLSHLVKDSNFFSYILNTPTMIHCTIVSVAFFFAIIIALRYSAYRNSRSFSSLTSSLSALSIPRAYGSLINSQAMRNEIWVAYFLMVAVRMIVRSASVWEGWYMEVNASGNADDYGLVESLSMALHGVTAWLLVCALQWQRRYRTNLSMWDLLRSKGSTDTPECDSSHDARYAPLQESDDDTHSAPDNSLVQDDASDSSLVHDDNRPHNSLAQGDTSHHHSHDQITHDSNPDHLDHDANHTSDHHDTSSHNAETDHSVEQHSSMHHQDVLAQAQVSARRSPSSLLSVLLSTEFLAFLFLVYYLIATLIRVLWKTDSEVPTYVHLSAVILQRLLILAVLLIIVFMPPASVRGSHASSPSVPVRIIALLSIFFNIPNDLPFRFWYDWTPWARDICIFKFISFYDFISLSYLVSLMLWMTFVVLEFHRTREQAMFEAFKITQASSLPFDDEADDDV